MYVVDYRCRCAYAMRETMWFLSRLVSTYPFCDRKMYSEHVATSVRRYVDGPTVEPGSPLNLAAATPCQRELGLQPSHWLVNRDCMRGGICTGAALQLWKQHSRDSFNLGSLWLLHVNHHLPLSTPTDPFVFATTRLESLPVPWTSTTAYSISSSDFRTATRKPPRSSMRSS